MANSWVFKDEESESEAKTNSEPRVCPLLVEGPPFACVEHAQCPLLVEYPPFACVKHAQCPLLARRVSTYTFLIALMFIFLLYSDSLVNSYTLWYS